VTSTPTSSPKPISPKKAWRILYADDMRELRHVAEMALPRDGHTIACCPDGGVAWQTITANPAAFDVVITDHHMPNMNGLELVTRLRTLPFRGKIIVFSSELSPEVSAAYHKLQVDKVLQKPVLPSELRQLLAKL
jgi:two-component system chemotaxis response regulator CheY